jgi:hypothetical protein
MKEFIEKGKQILSSTADGVVTKFESGLQVIQEVVNGLPVYTSFERSSKYDVKYDEKHYFVIPYAMSDVGFSLHTMRFLPDSVPEINDLPKRRIFHFPNQYYEASLREHMLSSAREIAAEKAIEKSSPLERLANDIDALDNKLTYGMLLVGGVAAIFNPIVGVGIAAKAMLPGVTGILAKYGLRPLGEKQTRSEVEKAIKAAEANVAKEFSESNTLKIVNPILEELELALRTTESEHDPLIDPNLSTGSVPELDSEHWRELTNRAIYHVYRDVYSDEELHPKASLGPEDIRWLTTVFEGIDG